VCGRIESRSRGVGKDEEWLMTDSQSPIALI
jgi:hypothetical protein